MCEILHGHFPMVFKASCNDPKSLVLGVLEHGNSTHFYPLTLSRLGKKISRRHFKSLFSL